MASTTAMMARAAVVAVLLMQCCNIIDILAARQLLHVAAGDDGRHGWQLGQGGEALTSMQGLNGPGQGNCGGFVDPNHPPCPSAAAIAAMP